MTAPEFLARLDASLRPYLVGMLPARASVAFYSWARQFALRMLAERECPLAIEPPPTAARVLWGIRFRAPLLNAAGMFKHGEGYELAYRQGAGAYLAGTTTARPRLGNVRRGIAQPFVPYPRSRAASNWLGLPNPGHRAVAARIAQLPRYEGFPIGASVALDPGDDSAAALECLVEGMNRYADAGVDFFELNESCPNTGDDQRGFDTLGVRLEAIAQQFVRPSGKPTLVKVSVDVEQGALERLIPLLVELGYAGITIGNTSTRYEQHRAAIAPVERRAYIYFTRTFGGGISGEPLRASMLGLVESARTIAARLSSQFLVIAVGGIARGEHLRQVLTAGAALAQWYTGYFERFARDGHRLYARVFSEWLHTGTAPNS
ncbi:MAG: dihydroorotate dehydrogenase 2 [Candidatus Kapaibacterium sp.]|nr:MAG: dihydroorotate dehydrogenase 2 [Candidatus Kapabacteria bacterium]